jgi:hypothetical protein
MTNVQENLGAQRTRRNIMKMGAILVAVVLARVKSAQASRPVVALPQPPSVAAATVS